MIQQIPIDGPRALFTALVVGIIQAVGIHLLAYLRNYDFVAEGWNAIGLLVWGTAGMVLLAGVPVFLFARYTLVLPIAIWILNLAFLGYAEFQSVGDGPVGLFLVGWPVVLILALVLGGFEYVIRSYFELAPPGTLAR